MGTEVSLECYLLKTINNHIETQYLNKVRERSVKAGQGHAYSCF